MDTPLEVWIAPVGSAAFLDTLARPTSNHRSVNTPSAPAVARLHAAPERRWTVQQFASSVAVSRSVGYTSEEAFSRAFKRAHAVSPGAWRDEANRPL